MLGLPTAVKEGIHAALVGDKSDRPNQWGEAEVDSGVTARVDYSVGECLWVGVAPSSEGLATITLYIADAGYYCGDDPAETIVEDEAPETLCARLESNPEVGAIAVDLTTTVAAALRQRGVEGFDNITLKLTESTGSGQLFSAEVPCPAAV
jgi:hypothetical protein